MSGGVTAVCKIERVQGKKRVEQKAEMRCGRFFKQPPKTMIFWIIDLPVVSILLTPVPRTQLDLHYTTVACGSFGFVFRRCLRLALAAL